MADSPAVTADWNAFSMSAARLGGEVADDLEVWSRFPLELDARNVVTPHLYAFLRADQKGRPDAGTIACPALFAAFAFRTPAHREFLRVEVLPRVQAHCPNVVLVDTAARTFEVFGSNQGKPLATLGTLLTDWTGDEGFRKLDLNRALDDYERFFGRGTDQISAPIAARLEAAPLRLWEALLLRGHARRTELIDGEVVLTGDLLTALAANRSMLQCVRDAEGLTGTAATETDAWIVVGRFRFRQHGPLLEIRVQLSPADVRIAFAPEANEEGAWERPSLVGALVAGGDNGKTELFHGYTWSSIRCQDGAELRTLSVQFAEEIRTWTGAEVRGWNTWGDEFPERQDGSWHVRRRSPDSPFMEIFMPLYRDQLLPAAVVV